MTIYNIINNFICMLFPTEAITIYQTYINDLSFIITILFVIIVVIVPIVWVWNIGRAIFYISRPKRETRGSKKRRSY